MSRNIKNISQNFPLNNFFEPPCMTENSKYPAYLVEQRKPQKNLNPKKNHLKLITLNACKITKQNAWMIDISPL